LVNGNWAHHARKQAANDTIGLISGETVAMTFSSISAIGKPMQIAFVPEDFDAALRHWTEALGVGPFFVMEDIVLEDGRFLGEPSNCRFTIALAQWGDVQIELIRQDNDAPSIYRGDYRPAGGAMHHVCLLTDDIAAARAAVEAGRRAGSGRGQSGCRWRGDLCRLRPGGDPAQCGGDHRDPATGERQRRVLCDDRASCAGLGRDGAGQGVGVKVGSFPSP
jgi:hypothetical protein